MAVRVDLAPRAERDLRALERRDRDTVISVLELLRVEPRPENLDVQPLEGRSPWMRLRVGEHCILLRRIADESSTGVLIARIVNRRDLRRFIASLG